MKVSLTDEDLKVRGDQNYFPLGFHEVGVTSAKRGVTANGKEFAEFEVLSADDEDYTGTARLWFSSDKSTKYALSILSGIASHNKETEAEKQKVNEAFKKITDTDQVDDKFLERFVGMEAFYEVADNGRTYTNESGQVRPSYDRNIYGYRKAQSRRQQVDNLISNSEDVSDSSDIPF